MLRILSGGSRLWYYQQPFNSNWLTCFTHTNAGLMNFENIQAEIFNKPESGLDPHI